MSKKVMFANNLVIRCLLFLPILKNTSRIRGDTISSNILFVNRLGLPPVASSYLKETFSSVPKACAIF